MAKSRWCRDVISRIKSTSGSKIELVSLESTGKATSTLQESLRPTYLIRLVLSRDVPWREYQKDLSSRSLYIDNYIT